MVVQSCVIVTYWLEHNQCTYACMMTSHEDRVDALDMVVTDSEETVPGGGVN